MLTNVIGFDVKAWDPQAMVLQPKTGPSVALVPGDPGYPTDTHRDSADCRHSDGNQLLNWILVGYGAYVDLNYYQRSGHLVLLRPARAASRALSGTAAGVYDTWSTHYEHDGIDQNGDGVADAGTNGFDDNDDGVVDDAGEMDTSPPYPVPLRGIQVRIRVFEPDSRQIREVTITQDFLPE